jgi:phospholipase C
MANQLGRIEHIVVLMLENRSFDNLLGWLYDPANPAPFNQPPPANFEGLYGKNLSNPTSDGRTIPAGKGTDLTAPNPDPGEPYQDVYAQIYGQKQTLYAKDVPPVPPTPCNMQGFVYNYELKNASNLANAATIMNCFTPASVPVLCSLAYYYGLCDHWFSSIPSQTLCNRSFVHAGTSTGYVNNDGSDGVLFVNKSPTIYNVLSDAGKSWKVYCGGWTVSSLVLLTQQQAWPFALQGDHFGGHISDFLSDAAKPGGLPAYSFLEPNYIDSILHGPENDMHPESHKMQLFGLSNVERGEQLLSQLYTAIRNSPDWDKILFLILFDEHGGCYDHVCPPTSQTCNFAVSPDGVVIPPDQPGGTGFQFDRLGVRVPAIVVSAYTPPQTIVNTVFDHTSALSTVVNCFGLPTERLGARQAKAPDVGEALSLSNARTDFPPIPAAPVEQISLMERTMAARNAILQANSKPLSDLQLSLVKGITQRLNIPVPAGDLEAETATAVKAEALLLKAQAEFAARRAVNRLW